MVILHDPLCEKEVSEEGGNKEIGSIQACENLAGERRPCDRVSDGRENPIEFTQRCPAILQISRQLHDHITRDVAGKLMIHEEVPKCYIDWRSEAGGEQISGKFWT